MKWLTYIWPSWIQKYMYMEKRFGENLVLHVFCLFFSDLVYMYLIRMLNIIPKKTHVSRPIFHFFSPWRKMLLETKCLLFSYMYLTWFGTLGLCSEIIVYWMEWDCVSLNLFDLFCPIYPFLPVIYTNFFVEFRFFFYGEAYSLNEKWLLKGY